MVHHEKKVATRFTIARPTQAEESAVRAALDAIGPGLFAALTADTALVVIHGAVRQVALTSPAVAAHCDALAAYAKRDGMLYSAGLVIGELRDGAFSLGIEGAYQVAAHTDAQSVAVTSAGEQLFLYGRDVLAESVTRTAPGIRPDDVVIVCNGRGEALGLGIFTGDVKKNRSVTVKNLRDRGWYLRRSM